MLLEKTVRLGKISHNGAGVENAGQWTHRHRRNSQSSWYGFGRTTFSLRLFIHSALCPGRPSHVVAQRYGNYCAAQLFTMAQVKLERFGVFGDSNWKDATEGFRRHEQSKCHGDAVQVMLILLETVRDIGESLSSAHAQNKAENHEVLLKILQNMKFLGCQGLALCGHDDIESNFMQLFKLCEIDNLELSTWRINRKVDKYLSPQVQNEMLQVMSLSILRSIAKNLHPSDVFTVMADEYTDVSNHEQLTICFRWVDTNLEVHEEFVGLYQIGNIFANTIVEALKDYLAQINLQCQG